MNDAKISEFEYLLTDRLQKIRQIIGKYGEGNFYISFSGGKDSTVLSYLIDMALPDNKIPRVYANTGIEYNIVVDFVRQMQEKDDRVVIIQPSVPIKPTLERYGYPFKNKMHSQYLDRYQRLGLCESVIKYRDCLYEGWNKRCPQKLRYQFEDGFNIRVSDKCCYFMKKHPCKEWSEAHNRPYMILGIMKTEGGVRDKGKCLAFNGKHLKSFSPLMPMSKEWEDWLINKFNIEICAIYKPPYNFDRTGCKGCPFNLHLQSDLDVLDEFFPQERKQCEIIWKPVYDEYRRIGYRLKPYEHQMTIDEWIKDGM